MKRSRMRSGAEREERPVMPATVETTQTLFPADTVSVQDVTDELALDVARAKEAAEEIERSARVRPDDMRIQVSM